MLSIALVIILGANEIYIERDSDLYAAPRVSECTWIDLDKAIQQAALETDLQVEIRRRLRALDYLPGLFQRQLDELKNIQTMEIETARERERSNCSLEKYIVRQECDEVFFHPQWKVLLPITGIIVLVVGMAAGYGIAR